MVPPNELWLDEHAHKSGFYLSDDQEQIKLDDGGDLCPIPPQRFVFLDRGR